jgi:hypothetical protein
MIGGAVAFGTTPPTPNCAAWEDSCLSKELRSTGRQGGRTHARGAPAAKTKPEGVTGTATTARNNKRVQHLRAAAGEPTVCAGTAVYISGAAHTRALHGCVNQHTRRTRTTALIPPFTSPNPSGGFNVYTKDGRPTKYNTGW